uniref:THUMP domain-containing protein n=1 Tax=Caenorhabditis tropicalis TaxID=1561998 RepID=A0A1I7UBJ3_9PELO
MANNDRKRKYNNWNQKVKQKSVEPGVTGLFFSCEGHEKQALQEAYSIIDELLEDPTISTASEPVPEATEAPEKPANDSDEEDIADSLKKACDDQRQAKPGNPKKKERRCIQRPTGVKNTIFVSVKNAKIELLSEKMVEMAQKSPRCRYLQRVYPVEHTLIVDLSKMNEILMKVISDTLKAGDDGKLPTYSVEFKARNNDSVVKSTVLQMVDDAVSVLAPTAKVNLNHADVTFFVQVSRTTIMIGVCRRFYERRKYSLRPVKEAAAE